MSEIRTTEASGRDPESMPAPELHQEENDSQYGSDSSDSDLDEQPTEEKKSRRPIENAFTQQRLRAYNPVLTAKTVIPLLILIAVVFVPLGAAMWLASDRIQDFAIDYSHCETMANTDTWSPIPQKYLTLNFNTKTRDIKHMPQWKLDTDDSQQFRDERQVCRIQFEVPNDVKGPIYFFYRLHNFYQNHRRYAKSFSEDQIEGKAASESDIKDTVGQNCEPLSMHGDKKIYPCGLIANSMFNDTYSPTLRAVNGTSEDYKLTAKGIAWKSDANRFKKTKYDYRDIVPPPNWYKWFPEGYNATNVPDVSKWEEYQNWMHTAALPTFNKLALRNDHDALKAGIYEATIGLHFPVLPYEGKKYIYISQRSVIGGKNYFLGISWMAGGGVCFLLGVVLLVVNAIKPRRTGDVSLLSWNQDIKQEAR